MLKTRGPTHIVVTTIRFLMVVICALPVLLLPHVAAGQAVVGGQNNPAVDVPAVQAAVDQGGSVLLVGTFDFGDAGRVLLRKDVDISGEIVGNATPVTTIRGGDWPFYSPLPAQMPPTQPGPKVTVQYIHFDGAKGVAVHLAYTGGASVHNNKMTGLRGRFLLRDTVNRTQTSDYFITAKSDNFSFGKQLPQDAESLSIAGVVENWHEHDMVGNVKIRVTRRQARAFAIHRTRTG